MKIQRGRKSKKKAYTFSCNNFRIVEFYFLRCWVFKLGMIMIKCFTPKSVAEFSTQVQIIYTIRKQGRLSGLDNLGYSNCFLYLSKISKSQHQRLKVFFPFHLATRFRDLILLMLMKS